MACDLASWYLSLCQHLAKGIRGHSSSDIDRLFKSLIEMQLSQLDDVPHEELPVIVVDASDECGGLRQDSSGRDDYKGLLRTLKRWVEVDHLRKSKLVITSRLDDYINRMFPNSISTHVDILSGNCVKLGDSATNDISEFLTLRLTTMGLEPAWISKALDYLVPRASGVFIWATTVTDFLEPDPESRFDILISRKRGTTRTG